MISLTVRSKTAVLFFSALVLFCVCLFVPFLSDSQYLHVSIYSIIMLMVSFTLISLYCASCNKGVVTPVGLFILSLVIFILARAYFLVFLDVVIIEIGERITFYNVLLTVAHIAAGLAFIVFGYIVFIPEKLKIQYFFSRNFRLSRFIISSILCVSVLLLLYFLKLSYDKYLILKTISYASAFELGTFHTHLVYFFLAKQLMLLWVFFSGNRNSFLLGSALLFLGSVGFILIGLRGYTIAYMFLFLYFMNERKKINIFLLVSVGLGLIYVAALVLEFRVGFKVFNGLAEIIPKTLYQQGASFEVVFGATVFPQELKSCISIFEYFSGKDFGLCVDRVRGIDWEFGGFASSFFAEAIYLGYIPYAFLCFVLGIALKYLDYLSQVRFAALKNGHSIQFIGLVLFATIPNLVYFARSSAFDLIAKVVSISLILICFAVIFSRRSKVGTMSNA
ncbi:MAG: hypothetical protein ACRBCS_13355 [Cellvibrionaceae bacterium]